MTSSQTLSSAVSKAASSKIGVKVGDTITVNVAKVEKHPESGVIVNVPGSPRGFIPTRLLAGKNAAAKDERRALLMASPGFSLDVVVIKAQVVKAKLEDGKTVKGERSRIILNEDRVAYGRIVKARQDAAVTTQEKVKMLKVGAWMLAKVKSHAIIKANGQCFGAFVELENGVPALLHKSEMLVPLEVGELIYVAIRALKADGDTTKISVTQKSKDDTMANFTRLSAGTKCSAVLLQAVAVNGVDGWSVQVDGANKAFLPLSEVDDLQVMKLSSGASLEVTIMPLVLGDHVRVSRRQEVIDVLSALLS